jgi:hypothetical protein
MRLIPHIDAIEIECETPMELSVVQRWLKCDAEVKKLMDYGASGPTGCRGISISFTPKADELLPSHTQSPETGSPGFRG